jgi:hypothetical protein
MTSITATKYLPCGLLCGRPSGDPPMADAVYGVCAECFPIWAAMVWFFAGAAGLLRATTGVHSTWLHQREEVMDERFYEDFDDDALAELADSLKTEGRRMLDSAGMAEFVLLKRLQERGASVLDTEHWAGKVEPGTWVIIDEDALKDILSLVPVELRVKCYYTPAPRPRWDHRALNEALKLGGEVAEAINTSRQRADSGTLKLERKKEAASG